MTEVVIVSAVRTPIGRIRGALASVRPDDLAAIAVREAVNLAEVDPSEIEEVYLGCANQAGEDNRNIARMAALLAGLPQEVAGVTVNRLCASGLNAVNQAARAIRCDEGDVFVAGGVESMTRAPYSLPKNPTGFGPSGNITAYDTTLGWRYPNPALESLFPLEAMGETAENIYEMSCDDAIEGGEISRAAQDRFALQSQQRAVHALNKGHFRREIVPVRIPQRRGEPLLVDRDEHPRCTKMGDGYRLTTSLEALGQLRPAFRQNGTVTAGNASGLNDGACALVLMSREKADALGIRPLARWVASAAVGIDPRVMGLGPVNATRKALKRAGLTIADIDLAEVNEAFAVQTLAVLRELGLSEAITNVNGGAIALGHPLGCSGARILTTLIHEMQRRAVSGQENAIRPGYVVRRRGSGGSHGCGEGRAMKQLPQITPRAAAGLVRSGDTILVGGFGMTGNPTQILHALAQTHIRDITYIANNVGEPGLGGGRMLRNGQISKAVGSFFTSNPEAVAAAQSGEIEFEVMPQGTMVEAIRAGGAGIGGFYTPTAAGTVLAKGRETKQIDGRLFVFQPALRANVALIRAWSADTAGNLVYRMTEQNFNRAMATAANLVIAEVEDCVPAGELPPESIHTPGCYVDYLVPVQTTKADLGSSASIAGSGKKADDRRMNMARRALAELNAGDIVNLGVGIPTLVADLITPGHGIILHTENGMLGVGPAPERGGAMEYPVNASKIPVTALPGSSYFDSADSFAMIRGGHVDVAIMGGLQVDERANLANWAAPGRPLLGVGGAMDLASGARRLIVTMTHASRDGAPKIVPSCTLPLTATNAVDVIITDLAVFRFPEGRLTLTELMPDASLEEIKTSTAAHFDIGPIE